MSSCEESFRELSQPRRLPKRRPDALERNRLSAMRMRAMKRQRYERLARVVETLAHWRAERDPGFGTAFFMLALEGLAGVERTDRLVELIEGRQ